MSERSERSGRDRCPDRSILVAVRIEREPLTLFSGDSLELAQGCAGLQRNGEIAGYVVDNTRVSRQRKNLLSRYRPTRCYPMRSSCYAQGCARLNGIANDFLNGCRDRRGCK